MRTHSNLSARARRWAQSALAGACLAGALAAQAQDVPATIKVLVGFPAGAGTDLVARAYADALAKELRKTVIVDNRPGAGGQIAARALKDAAADGSTLLLAIDHQIVTIPLTVKAPGYKPEQDFQPLLQLATYDICAGVSGQSTAHSFVEWTKLANADPSQRSIGVPAPGSNAHFLAQAIGRHFGVPMIVVPYKGGSPLITDLSGGHVSAFVLPCGDPIVTAHENGRARILLTSAEKGHPRVPNATSFKREGIQTPSSAGYFMAVYAHAKVPPQEIEALQRASTAAAMRPDVAERIAASGMVPLTVTASEMKLRVAQATAAWAELIRASGFRAE